MADIAKTSIHLSANSVGLQSDLQKAGGYVKDFAGKTKSTLRDYAEGVGRVREAFASLNNLDLSNPISALQGLKSQLELVVLSAKSAKVALLSLGVGAALAIGGSILASALGGGRREETAGGTGGGGGGGGFLRSLPIGEASIRREELERVEREHRAAIDARHVSDLARVAGLRGPIRDRTALAGIDRRESDPRGLLEFDRADERSWRMSDPMAGWRLRREAALGRSELREAESTERGRSMRDLARSTREDTATLGMGAEAAALAGLAREDTERVARHTTAVRELERAYAAGSLGVEEYRRRLAAVASATSAEEGAARGAAEAIREAGRARLAESLRSPLELASRRISEIRALGASGDVTDRSIGSLLMGMSGGADFGRNAPSALQMGTVAAVDAANRIARETAAANVDPVERVRLAIEHSIRVEEETRRATEDIGRALREGRIVLPAGRR